MSSISGVQQYIARTLAEEKQCLRELHDLVVALAADRLDAVRQIEEKLIKARNISRDLGWMRRLLADLRNSEAQPRREQMMERRPNED